METRKILDAAAADRLSAVYVLAVHLGLRRAELFGLRWADVDLDGRRLAVVHSLQRVDGQMRLVPPKTPASHRTLPLPTSVVAALQAPRDRQNLERAAAGARWTDDGPTAGLVFCTPTGGPMHPDALRPSWTRIRQVVDGPVRLHDLRHTCLTLLLDERTHRTWCSRSPGTSRSTPP